MTNLSQFGHSVMSNSLQPHGLQHARLPCPSPTPKVCSTSCPSSRWCHPTVLSSAAPFSSYLQSFPASGSFLMSQFFASGGQSIGVSASASVLPVNIQDWYPWKLTGLIFSQSNGLSSIFSNTTVQKHQFFSTPLFFFFFNGLTIKKCIKKWRHHFSDKGQYSQLRAKKLMHSNCGAGEDGWGSLGQQGDQAS